MEGEAQQCKPSLGLSNGLIVDADYYSDEDTTDVKVKTTFEHRPPPGQGNWAYIPIPYFIPHQLYNNWFLNPAGLTHLQPGLGGNFPFPGTAPYQDLNAAQSLSSSSSSSAVSSSSSVAHLENGGNVAAIARGRLTRQATKPEPTAVGGSKRKKDSGADDVSVTTTEKDTTAEEAAAAEVEAVTATTARPEITESTTEAVNKLPSAGLDSGITGLAGEGGEGGGDPAATSPPSFEVGEWEYLGSGTVTPTVNNTDDLKSNQTSSYYRRIVQAFDPDKVSFTTWYPEAGALKLQDSPGDSPATSTVRPFVVAYPFRPSEEYNGNSLFQPVVGPAAASPQRLDVLGQVGLEPPVLPHYY